MEAATLISAISEVLGLCYMFSIFGLFGDTANEIKTEASITEATKAEIPASEDPADKAAAEMVKTAAAAVDVEANELAKVNKDANKLPKREVAGAEFVKSETPAATLYSSTREAAMSYLTLATTYLTSFTLAKLALKVGLTAYSSCSNSSYALVEAFSLLSLSILVFFLFCSLLPLPLLQAFDSGLETAYRLRKLVLSTYSKANATIKVVCVFLVRGKGGGPWATFEPF